MMTGTARKVLLDSLLAAGMAAGCKTSGDFVWADSLPAPRGRPARVRPPGGRAPSASACGTRIPSDEGEDRPDRRVSLPFLNDVEAAGPHQPRWRSASRVGSRTSSSIRWSTWRWMSCVLVVSVLGEVFRPGTYPMEACSGVLQALAAAGGMTPFADKDEIIVIRLKADGSGTQRIRFTYSGLTQQEGRAAAFRLQGGDVVVVE